MESTQRKLSKSNEVDIPSQEQMQETPLYSDSFDTWYTEYTRGNKHRLGTWDAELLDEINLLLQDVESSRRD